MDPLVYKLVAVGGGVTMVVVEDGVSQADAMTNLEAKMALEAFTLGGIVFVRQNILFATVVLTSAA